MRQETIYMARKVTDGPYRNKQRTIANFIKAVGQILQEDGFSGLNVSRVAEQAKADRKLLYNYFGSLDGLIKEYLNSRDYWKIAPDDIEGLIKKSKKDSGKALAYHVLEDQFESLMANEEMRRIINWGLSEKAPVLKELDLKRENTGEEILKAVFDEHFKDSGINFRAVYGLLMGGVYYLTLHANMQENPFCGIDIKQPEGQEEIRKAIRQLLDLIYSYGIS
ncbi:TetR/AcrR family transcriptional regulator [Chryseobacterium profundimaris]|uniref:Transcriptional regulator, TetR family n=1 Tax=Chryseobacterium profundimaris TaxID=1387275 RepID=A0ABY1NEZ0_9FLAO|nr:TetR/AcrR family transcriptional regulator [Chryseobacterium profundimaris]SMP07741.1 transcriptional regulator, TetR family [Chryseobacterium profundimaris]